MENYENFHKYSITFDAIAKSLLEICTLKGNGFPRYHQNDLKNSTKLEI